MPINVHGELDFPENPENNQLFVDDNDTQWRFNGADWAIFEPYYINELPDVDTETIEPKVGDQLEWNGTKWVPIAESLELGNLSDVNLSSPNNNDFLVWSGTEWVNITFTGHNKTTLQQNLWTVTSTPLGVEADYVWDGALFTSDSNMVDLINNRIIILDEGLYYISFSYETPAGGASQSGYQVIKLYNSNDSVIKSFYLGAKEISNTDDQSISRVLYFNMNAGDYIKARYVTPTSVGGSGYDHVKIRLTALRISAKA